MKHIDVISKQELHDLMAARGGARLSLYLPTAETGREVQQSPIRLKNLLKNAEEQIEKADVSGSEKEQLLEPVRQLVEDAQFWRVQGSGLAVFVDANGMQTFRCPVTFEEQVSVGERFLVKPLLPVVSRDQRFYLLAISENRLRLFRGTRESIGELRNEDLPQGLSDALRTHDWEERLHQHVANRAGASGSGQAMYHGHGTKADKSTEKQYLLRYFQKVDNALAGWLHDETAPLVLACVEYYSPLYREANHYNYLLEEEVSGSPDEMSADELHRKAWPIVEKHVRQSEEEAATAFKDVEGTEQTSVNLNEVLPAALEGRIGTLFVARDEVRWGTFDEETLDIEYHEEPRFESADLLDVAATYTQQRGGEVFVVASDRMPTSQPVATVFRY